MSGANSTFSAPVEVIGDKIYLAFENVSTPGTSQELFSFTVDPGKVRKIYSVSVDCRSEGRCRIIHTDSSAVDFLIGSFRTGPAEPFEQYVYQLPYDIPANETLTVDFMTVSNSPIIDIAGFVHLTERTQ